MDNHMAALETGSGFAGYKIIAGIVAFLAPVFAFVLGLQVIPLDKKDPHADAIRRLMGCATSSMVVGGVSLVVLYRLAPWTFHSAAEIGGLLGEPLIGVIWLFAVVLLLGALPGWWLVGAVMRRLATWRDKNLDQIIEDANAIKAKVRP